MTASLITEFETALPHLIAAYRQGRLVPFLGSGMSIPACTGWIEFVSGLARSAGLDRGSPVFERAVAEGASSQDLYRLADAAVRRLQISGASAFGDACRQALRMAASGPPGQACAAPQVPEQTRVLASVYWGLVLTTNYDDIFLQAAASRRYRLLGQSLPDCHEILRSLDTTTPPLLWALQGYLGRPEVPSPPLSTARRDRFGREVVVGHREYQAVINSRPHLRRAIAEVYRRRSLLFLGSGVQEDYLVNLFGEIIYHHGASAHPHFALLPASERERVDEVFFATRLGVHAIFYGEHAELPGLLDQLVREVRVTRQGETPTARRSCWLPSELAFTLHQGSNPPPPDALTLRLRYGALPDAGRLEPDRCIAASVGREGGLPARGLMMKDVLDKARAAGLVERPPSRSDWRPLDAGRYVFRLGLTPLFAVAAREPEPEVQGPGDPPDRGDEDPRNLSCIAPATTAALQAVNDAGYARVSLGVLAAGPGRPWPAVFPFVQMLAGIQQFASRATRTGLREIELCIIDGKIWFALLAGKVPVAELLVSPLVRVWVQVMGDDGEIQDVHGLVLPAGTTVGGALAASGLSAGTWKVWMHPSPGESRPEAWHALPVFPTATLVIASAAAASRFEQPAGAAPGGMVEIQPSIFTS